MDQFAVGFPIAGILSQKHVFEYKTPNRPILARTHLFGSAEPRFRERAGESGWANAAVLRTESMAQVEKGRLCDPVALAESGAPEGYAPGGYNVAFRFGVEQASKLRACDGLKRCMTNQACVTEAPSG